VVELPLRITSSVVDQHAYWAEHLFGGFDDAASVGGRSDIRPDRQHLATFLA
jgi:hypothetical protein